MAKRRATDLEGHVKDLAARRTHHRHAHAAHTSRIIAEADAQTRKEATTSDGGSAGGSGQR